MDSWQDTIGNWWVVWGTYTHPHTTGYTIVAALVAAAVLWWALHGLYLRARTTIDSRRARDPQRLYTTAQRRNHAALCGHRCEGARHLGPLKLHPLRCRTRLPGHPATGLALFAPNTTAGNGDHHYPHARGGATTPQNLVTLCARCNSRKGAKYPTLLDTWLIARRRRAYYPPGTTRKPGEWYRHRGA